MRTRATAQTVGLDDAADSRFLAQSADLRGAIEQAYEPFKALRRVPAGTAGDGRR